MGGPREFCVFSHFWRHVLSPPLILFGPSLNLSREALGQGVANEGSRKEHGKVVAEPHGFSKVENFLLEKTGQLVMVSRALFLNLLDLYLSELLTKE